MKVKATRLGYYKHKRRREGDVFSLLDPSHFSTRWMEKVGQAESPQEEEEVLQEAEESEAPIKKKKKAKKKVSKKKTVSKKEESAVDLNKDVLE